MLFGVCVSIGLIRMRDRPSWVWICGLGNVPRIPPAITATVVATVVVEGAIGAMILGGCEELKRRFCVDRTGG